MTHPVTAPYALGLVDDEGAAEVESHLATCASCRAAVRRIREAAAHRAEAHPPVAPDPSLRERVLASVRPTLAERRGRTGALPSARRWLPLTAAAAAITVLAGGVALERHLSLDRVDGERAVVAGWLTRDDVTTWPLDAPVGGRSPGSVMVAEDGTVLVVLRETPPQGSAYQVWGSGDAGPVALASGRGTVLRVDASGYRAVGISVEPQGDSSGPSAPLGWVSLGGAG